MKKFKVTSKEVKENVKILSVGYCELSHLLKGVDPVAYNAGVYGWNYDVYYLRTDCQKICICTGYRGMPKTKNVKKDYAIIEEYENKAKELIKENWLSNTNTLCEDLEELRKQFINEITKKEEQ